MTARYFITIASLLILTACGQKGPLYLPENEPETASAVQQQEDPSLKVASQREQDK